MRLVQWHQVILVRLQVRPVAHLLKVVRFRDHHQECFRPAQTGAAGKPRGVAERAENDSGDIACSVIVYKQAVLAMPNVTSGDPRWTFSELWWTTSALSGERISSLLP